MATISQTPGTNSVTTISPLSTTFSRKVDPSQEVAIFG